MSSQGLLLLVRHGVALEDHPLGDAARPLSKDGRAAFSAHARRLARRFEPARVVTSPLLRAVQTAELLAHAAGCDQVEVDGALGPHPLAPVALERLARQVRVPTALVGHEPSLSCAAAKLLGLAALDFPFKKGGALCLAPGAGRTWRALWFWAPARRRKRRPA